MCAKTLGLTRMREQQPSMERGPPLLNALNAGDEELALDPVLVQVSGVAIGGGDQHCPRIPHAVH